MPETLITSEVLRRLEQLTLVSRRVATGRLRGERRSRRRGASNDFADYRNYVTGDDLRFLDWKVYARLEKLFLKLFLEEEDLQVHLLVDSSASMDTGEPNKLHYARQVAAAIGYIAMCRMDSLTVRGFAAGLTVSFGPKRGKVNAARYFDFLQRLTAQPRTDLNGALRGFSTITRGRGVVVVISDFYDFSGYEDGLRQLFGRAFDVFVLHVLSPQELKPDLQGDVRLVDCEFDTTTDVSLGPALLAQYEKTLNAFSDGLRRFVVTRGGTYLLTSTALAFDRLVLDVLCRKGMLR